MNETNQQTTNQAADPVAVALAPLGIIARCTSPLRSENRRERFKLQSLSAKIHAKDAAKKVTENRPHFSQVHRVCGCCWSSIAGDVLVMKSNENTAHYKNVMTCGSTWVCPICSAKTQEVRRGEIACGMDSHYKAGGKCIMVTLTAPHYSHQSLVDLRKMQAKALTALRSGKNSATNFHGYLGLIRSLEVTISEKNGWHLHTHELWFVDSACDAKALKEKILSRWQNVCVKAGLLDPNNASQVKAFLKHSVDIKDNARCSDYLAKQDDSRHWGADREIAKSVSKSGKKSGYHPFGLLAALADEEDPKRRRWFEERFLEYGLAMKGSRQIFWSKGLKAHFNIGEKTDEEIAAEETEHLTKMLSIDKKTWHKIRAVGARASVLEVAEIGLNELILFVDSFKDDDSPPPPPPLPLPPLPPPDLVELSSYELFDLGYQARCEIKKR